MSNIDKQAQYESKFSRLWERYDEASHGNAEQMRDILEVTLDALESAERQILRLEKLAEAESVGADKAAASGVEWMKRCMAAEKLIAELASLEAVPVGTFKKGPCGYHPSFHEDAVPLYTAPPAPVSVPDGYRLQPISEYDAMCAAMLQGADGNSPVIPDGWVACSERMPEDDDFVYIWPRPDFGVELHVGQYCECHPKGDGWYAQVHEQNYGIEWCPITVTHWMPLPAAPKQELK
ncbi:DUF551 domain-containing protein [Enterobacter roggenkampii]|uniref:DUF551 domain-containing protein n=1 Tax=Enterobacter roggenkampii TaxID=1812935 RepID=UPI000AAEB9B5|nr:DUF551 domain-containing protein [Enterobacter roggenkampii]